MDKTPNTFAIMPAPESKPVTDPMYQIHAEVRRLLDTAVLIRYAGQQMWLPTTPKSGVTVGDARGGKLTPIWLPLWLARKKGIVSAPRPRRRP